MPNPTGDYLFICLYSPAVWNLLGPIVIHDPDDPNNDLFDYEYVMTVSDWYHIPTGDPSMLPTLFSANYQGIDPIPDSAEISGVGQYNCSIPTCVPSKFATYSVTKGKRYRFRIINISAMSHFWISIDEHPLTVIEVDGTPIHPVKVEMLPINSAQRYSVVVTANNAVGNYWIRAQLSGCSLPDNNFTINFNSPIFENGNITGILRYEGAPPTNPTSVGYSTSVINCYDLDSSLMKPYPQNPPVPPKDANVTRLNFNVAIKQNPEHILEATMNNSSFVSDLSYPTNQRVIDGVGFISSDNAYPYYVLNGAVEIVINNTEPRTHPFHMHGHEFWVIAQGDNNSYNKPLDTLTYNYDNPPLRDTATVKERG
ncbi:6583_t:CDS:2 [Acaulospora colombiana]|uniref:6583_t:CDS:1 n=1 Tax=Acaulospora colombiana TaxID=27376 RepID=A0ACA9L7A4_9GLOM|nr:6583_t:CDS:2 [Acaulospora colombiana]